MEHMGHIKHPKGCIFFMLRVQTTIRNDQRKVKSFLLIHGFLWEKISQWILFFRRCTLQGINISHLGKFGKSSSKCHFWGDMWSFPGGYVFFQHACLRLDCISRFTRTEVHRIHYGRFWYILPIHEWLENLHWINVYTGMSMVLSNWVITPI